MMLKTKDLKVAEVRYYDAQHRGIEYTPPLSYVILINNGDFYDNILSPGVVMPIYKRIPRTTNAYSTEDYFGTKIERVCGNDESGEVWLLTGEDLSEKLRKPEVELSEVEEFVLNSGDFYHNRAEIIEQRLSKNKRMGKKERTRLVVIKQRDSVKQREMDAFFAERGVKKVMQK